MNFLQIAQRTARACKLKNWPGLTTVDMQGGEFRDIIDAVHEAWRDIQTRERDWDWMRVLASFTTVAGQDEYPLGTGAGTVGVAAASFGHWKVDTFRNYVTSVGTNSEFPMDWMEFDAWRDTYRFGALRSTRSRPTTIAVTPDHGIALGPNVNDGYTVTGYYYSAPTVLALKDDVPVLPERFHMAIVWRAAELFCGEQDEDKYVRLEAHAKGEFGRLLRQLSADRLPAIDMAGPIA